MRDQALKWVDKQRFRSDLSETRLGEIAFDSCRSERYRSAVLAHAHSSEPQGIVFAGLGRLRNGPLEMGVEEVSGESEDVQVPSVSPCPLC